MRSTATNGTCRCSSCRWQQAHVAKPNNAVLHLKKPVYVFAIGQNEQSSAPLIDAVRARGDKLHDTPLHVPGHKRGRAVDQGFKQMLDAGKHHPTGSYTQETRRPLTEQGCEATCLKYDLTELSELDFLSSPSGVIEAAQDLAAAAFGAQHTWFLVNGCSVAIHAAVMSTLQPGQALLLARNCHLSAFSACVLADAVPVWLWPEEDATHGVANCITPQQLQDGFQQATQRRLKVGAVLVVSPTYYGAVAHVEELAAICHHNGVPLLVDEAHGAHLGFMAQDLAAAAAAAVPANTGPGQQNCSCTGVHDAAASHQPEGAAPVKKSKAVQDQAAVNTEMLTQPPPAAAAAWPADMTSTSALPETMQQVSCSAVAAGADLVMQSTHKVLTAMTQAAMLHLTNSSRVDPSRVDKALQILQTSSPSYLLLCSLDGARRHAITPGVWLEPAAVANTARAALSHIPGLVLLQDGSCGAQSSVAGFDPLRLVVNVQGLGLSGFDAAAWIEQQYGVVPELATSKLVVLVVGPGSKQADAAVLVQAFQQLSKEHRAAGPLDPRAPSLPDRATDAMIPPASTNMSTRHGTQSTELPEPLSTGRPPSAAAEAATLTPRQAFFAQTQKVPLLDAVGRISAELLCPYPPGVPIVFPGEPFTPSIVSQLRHICSGGGMVTGGQDSTLRTVLVVVGHS